MYKFITGEWAFPLFSFTHFLDMVLTVNEIFLTGIHDAPVASGALGLTGAVEMLLWLALDFPYALEGRALKNSSFLLHTPCQCRQKIAIIGGSRHLCNSTGERCQWILSASDYKLVNILLENKWRKRGGKKFSLRCVIWNISMLKIFCACIVLTRWETVTDLFSYWYRMPNSQNICQHLLEAGVASKLYCVWHILQLGTVRNRMENAFSLLWVLISINKSSSACDTRK